MFASPPPRGSRGAHFVVAVLARADDGTVAHAARDLPGQSARGRHAADVPVGVHAAHVDRAARPVDHDVVLVIQPVVVRTELGPPAQPVLAAFFGQQVLFLEAHVQGEALRAFADQHDVIGVIHDRLGHQRRRGDVLQRGDRTRPPGGSVHDGRVQGDDAVGIRTAAQPHRLVIGIQLLDVDAGNDRVERVGLVLRHHLVGLRDTADSVTRGDYRGRRGRGMIAGKRGGVGLRGRGEAGQRESGGFQESAAGDWHGRTSLL